MSASASLNEHLSDSAQRQLAVLRAALETRLAVLEDVLAHPSRGESLEGLILDLARVATEEAQAAASQACVDTKVEADRQIAEAGGSAQALEQERAISANLRRAIDEAHEQISLLEADQQAGIRALREQVDADAKRVHTSSVDLERAVADARTQLEIERASSAELRLASERAEEQFKERLASLQREQTAARSAHDVPIAELARERETVAALQRAQAKAQSDLEETESRLAAERATNGNLRQAAEAAGMHLGNLERDISEGQTARDALETELAGERGAIVALQRDLAETQSHLERERASSADLRLAVEQAAKELSSLQNETDHKQTTDEELALQLEHERAETVTATAAANEAQAELATARHEAHTLGAQLAAHQAQLQALQMERDAVAGELERTREILATQQKADQPLPAGDGKSPSQDKGAPAAHTKKPPAKPTSSSEAEDWQAVRLATRYVFDEEIEIRISAGPGLLVDLSVVGCQLLSPVAMKVNHAVTILLPSDQAPITCIGRVVWARLEPATPVRPRRYRAGVCFTDADEAAIESFATSRGATA